MTPNLYLMGHYGTPTHESDSRPLKLQNECNSARIESLFYRVSGELVKSNPGFPAVAFYKEVEGISSSYMYNCEDERSWLEQYPFFNRHMNKLFSFTPMTPLCQTAILDSTVDIDSTLDIDVFNEDCEFEKDTPDSKKPVMHLTSDSESETNSEKEGGDGDGDGDGEDDDDDISSFCSESVNDLEEELTDQLYIHSFPVVCIHIEKCDCTLADLIQSSVWSAEMVSGMLFQIAAILWVYQKKFEFTHNDLHTNNIMCNRTDAPYVYYTIDGKVYKIPTHGYIYKLIDFNRCIFTWNGKTYYSDEYAIHENAYGVYNSGPYYNKNKPTCAPNPAFDLCYLACSLFNTLIPVCVDADQLTPLQKLLIRWVTDKHGNNIVRSRTGVAKNDGIKLYKVIARHMEYPVPRTVILNEPLFQEFISTEPVDYSSPHICIDRI